MTTFHNAAATLPSLLSDLADRAVLHAQSLRNGADRAALSRVRDPAWSLAEAQPDQHTQPIMLHWSTYPAVLECDFKGFTLATLGNRTRRNTRRRRMPSGREAPALARRKAHGDRADRRVRATARRRLRRSQRACGRVPGAGQGTELHSAGRPEHGRGEHRPARNLSEDQEGTRSRARTGSRPRARRHRAVPGARADPRRTRSGSAGYPAPGAARNWTSARLKMGTSHPMVARGCDDGLSAGEG